MYKIIATVRYIPQNTRSQWAKWAKWGILIKFYNIVDFSEDIAFEHGRVIPIEWKMIASEFALI